MSINLRPITDADLKWTESYEDTRGRVRWHVSLVGASWINHVWWIHPRDKDKPETLTKIKTMLTDKLRRRCSTLNRYLETNNTPKQ